MFSASIKTKWGKTKRGIASAPAYSVRTLLVAALLGLNPLAASGAATPDSAAVTVNPATSAAIIELVPVPASETAAVPNTANVADPTAIPDMSAPAETTLGRGSASYYAAKFHGRRTASGDTFNNNAMTAAHRTLPFGTKVRVTNPATGASVVVRINDRGPFTKGRLIDVSRAAAEQLGLIARGHATVELGLIEN